MPSSDLDDLPQPARYTGDADPNSPGGMSAIYRDLIADADRVRQIPDEVHAALARERHCMLLTQWTKHLDQLAADLR